MFGLNPYARVRTERELHRLAKQTRTPLDAVRRLLHDARVCDLCGPDEYAHLLEYIAQGHLEPNPDFVQRRPRDGSAPVWVHRDCAPTWESQDEMNLADLERFNKRLDDELRKLAGH